MASTSVPPGQCIVLLLCALRLWESVSAQNLSMTVGKMAADEYNDSDRFSDDDVYDNLGENDFDLFELTEEERAELANAFKDDSESGDELDDENLPLFFTQPRFEWTGGGHCCDTRHTSDVQCRCVQRQTLTVMTVLMNEPLLLFSSPFQGHRQCDKWNFWRQFLCGCYLGSDCKHVPFLLACEPVVLVVQTLTVMTVLMNEPLTVMTVLMNKPVVLLVQTLTELTVLINKPVVLDVQTLTVMTIHE